MWQDISAESTFSALRRFFAARGTPSTLCSDNGTNLTAAAKEFSETIDSTVVHKFFGISQIPWNFNPAHVPHFGCIWERLICCLKNAIYAIIGNKTLTADTFKRVLCEIEQFMNARPISTVLHLQTILNTSRPTTSFKDERLPACRPNYQRQHRRSRNSGSSPSSSQITYENAVSKSSCQRFFPARYGLLKP